jgi:hypothetical protein
MTYRIETKEGVVQRIYFLLPDVPAARSVIEELSQLKLDHRDIHIVSGQAEDFDETLQSPVVESSEIRHLLVHGIAAGVVVGTIAGLAAMLLLPAGFTLSHGGVLAMTLAGTAFGGWLSMTAGMDQTKERYRFLIASIQQGDVLMIVDASDKQAEVIRNAVRHRCPHALLESDDHMLAIIR